MNRHPLDRPVWSALTTRQRHLAIGDELARRFDPEIGPFAAVADDDPAHLAGSPVWSPTMDPSCCCSAARSPCHRAPPPASPRRA